MPPEPPDHQHNHGARARAFGFAQRRAWVFWAWWYGATMAIAGAVMAGLARLVGHSAELGITLLLLGGVLAAAGWLLTVGWRFTRKIPKPATDIPRVEQSIRITPGIVWCVGIGAVLIVIALVVLTPAGGSTQALPLLGVLLAFLWSTAAGFAYTGWVMKNSAHLYARWLARR